MMALRLLGKNAVSCGGVGVGGAQSWAVDFSREMFSDLSGNGRTAAEV